MGQASQKPQSPQTPAGEKMADAVHRQQDLLAEFEKIVTELNNVLANLEGSTLVKRLKAASRQQYRVAGRLGDSLDDSFGPGTDSNPDSECLTPPPKKPSSELAEVEAKSSDNISTIMDDLQAYFERRRFLKCKTVLEEMKSQDVVGALRQIADDLSSEPGLSIAQCEYWWDTLDRWAEDLVDPAKGGTARGSSARDSLPPAIVLEVLRILEGEVNLREETRVAQQARAALNTTEFAKRADKLSHTQDELERRVEKVTQEIRLLPDAKVQFPDEVRLLQVVAEIMHDATAILAPRDRSTGDRRRDRGHRAAASIAPHQSARGWRRRFVARRRRWRDHQGFRDRAVGSWRQSKREPRAWRRRASGRHRGAFASRRVSRRFG